MTAPHPPARRPARPGRTPPPEVAALRELKADHPELATAVDLHLDLLDIQRRVQSRLGTPLLQLAPAWVQAQVDAGRPVLRFADIPIEWTEFRLALRQTAELLRRHEALERADEVRLQTLARDSSALERLVVAWYNATIGEPIDDGPIPPAPDSIDHQVLALALRPFLARAVEALGSRLDLSGWRLGRCPLCWWEPEFSVLTQAGERRLICGRCTGQWIFDPHACPFCGNDDRSRLTSFATPDGRYRVAACDSCRRYLKAYDARGATRSVMLTLDLVATLPLDAAAVQRGYSG